MSQHNSKDSYIKCPIDIPDDLDSYNSSDFDGNKIILDSLNFSEKFTNEFTGIENNYIFEDIPLIEKEKEKEKEKEEEKEKENVNENIKPKESNEKKFLGRKRMGDNSTSVHDKYSDDNTRRKIKRIIISNLYNFINIKIEDIYGDEVGEGMVKKRLMILGQKHISNASVAFDQEFLYKTLKNIFSQNISTRITNYSPDRNKEVINELINDENKERSNYFKGLFNITFLDCLRYFRGDNIYNEYLQGFEKFSDIKEIYQNEEGIDYTNHLIKYLQDYETKLFNKKPRRRKKTKMEKLTN